MEMINRVAVMVRPREPYFAWARQLDEEGPSIDEMAIDDLSAVYLMESEDDPEPILRRRFGSIFEEQLESWHRIPGDWPQRRTYEMFREWFDVQLVDLVYDLEETPLVDDGDF